VILARLTDELGFVLLESSGGAEGRDLWRIVVDSKHLVQTLKAGRVRDYQIVGKGKVPIKSIERLA